MLSDLARLRALRSVVSHQSFSRAAEQLGYTQSAISQQVAALEDEVGLTLIDRGVRPVAPTDAGRVLLEHAEFVLEHVATAEARLDAIRGVSAGRLRLVAFPSAFATFLPSAIAEFGRRHPDVDLELAEVEPDAARALLRAGDADIAIAYELGEAADDGLDVAHLLDDEHRVVLHARHRLAKRQALTVRDLADEPLIVPHAEGPAHGYREMLERLFADAGVEPRIAFETDEIQAVQAFVAARLGIALMHDLTLPTLRRSVVVRPLEGPRLTRRVTALTVPGRSTPAAAAMLDVLTLP
jgi:DNA-binding transcriptional LysR family regulator